MNYAQFRTSLNKMTKAKLEETATSLKRKRDGCKVNTKNWLAWNSMYEMAVQKQKGPRIGARVTDLQDDLKIVQLYLNEEWTIRRIAESMNCAYGTVHYRLKVAGVKFRKRGGRRPKEAVSVDHESCLATDAVRQ